MVEDGLQGEAMMLPRREVVRAVHGDTAAFDLVFGLVFAKPPEFAFLVDCDAAGVGVYQIAVGIVPPPAGHNVLGLRETEEEDREPHGWLAVEGWF